MSRISTCLWFDRDGEAAARFYTSLLPNSRIDKVTPYKADTPGGKTGDTMIVDFTLDGQRYQALNGGPVFKHSAAASIIVLTEDQAETDRLWHAFLDGGGTPVQCGWLTDRWGLSWQIMPRRLVELTIDADGDSARRATEAMLGQIKIDIAEIERAAASA
ncbi:VOC family protein [Emcibacter sp. SYSU 3D8]|uniref:VOC family protein n=1 Tax=Emcibacter sp. SYSU 3D8 TaxID=3133969 RepID=UPI0031FEFCC4